MVSSAVIRQVRSVNYVQQGSHRSLRIRSAQQAGYILRAEGEKRSSILVAEGEKEAVILRAEAKKAAMIAEAEGTAQAIRMINDANPNAAYLTLKGYDALKIMADGNATKIIVPSEIQNVTGLLASLKAVVENEQPANKLKPAPAEKDDKQD